MADTKSRDVMGDDGAHRRARRKLDPRLAFLLSLPREDLFALQSREYEKLAQIGERIRVARHAVETSADDRPAVLDDMQSIGREVFVPLSAGIYRPDTRTDELLASVFLISDASSADLRQLGAAIRSQAGDVFTASVPLDSLARLEASTAVRYIELGRPQCAALDNAIPFVGIDALHAAVPPVDGSGVVVGIFDTMLDVYHPDFRTATGATRVAYLWDQRLVPVAGESGPPTGSALPGFLPAAGSTYGVEYDRAKIDLALTTFVAGSGNAYTVVRHGGDVAQHGTHVAGIAAGNGLGNAGTYTGAAPGADLIFVAYPDLFDTGLLADSTYLADGVAYIFARATAMMRPCVINISTSDNQGPHDGSTAGEQFLDNLLKDPGRAVTISSGNSNNTAAHAAGTVPSLASADLVVAFAANADQSDDIELWYDDIDRLDVTITIPTTPATIIGPVVAGAMQTTTLPSGVQVQVTSVLGDPRNGDNLISIIILVPAGKTIPAGNWTMTLYGASVLNGSIQAWIDRNNRGKSAFAAPFLKEGTATLGVPSTSRRALSVGNHRKVPPAIVIQANSGCGPARDGRIKPELAAVGTQVTAPRSRDMNLATPGALYVTMTGTSMSAPLVAGACALLFQCRGPSATWAHLAQILEQTAGTSGLTSVPGNEFGFGYLQMASACAAPTPVVDVWLRDDITDTGVEPFTGPVAWLSPDIEVLDLAGNPIPNPVHDASKLYSNIVRVTVRNRGTQPADNTEVYLYWADPATYIPYPAEWKTVGIYTGSAAFPTKGNSIVVPKLAAGGSASVQFGWSAPAAGGNIGGDDHFCLLVRVENQSDPSQVGAGGWSVISARNNIALHNLNVIEAGLAGDAISGFEAVGSGDDDSLAVETAIEGVVLEFPAAALPWRDIAFIERLAESRRLRRALSAEDAIADIAARLLDDEVTLRTDVTGAAWMEVRAGIVHVAIQPRVRLRVPSLRLAEGVRLPVRLRVAGAKLDELDGERRFVHVSQYSGGQLVGGVSLELRNSRMTSARDARR